MKKLAWIVCVAALCTGCAPQGMQGNPAATMVGAQVGGLAGALIGDSMNGYRGSLFGSLIGTISGAMIGNALTTPRQEEGYYVEETYGYEPEPPRRTPERNYRPRAAHSADLAIRNIRFIDANRNQMIDANETAQIVFEVINVGRTDAYHVTPIISELNNLKHLYISPSASIECVPAGEGIRYTANIRTERRLKDGEALFRITVLDGNGVSASSRSFAIPTRRR